ncbi:MAG: TIGR01244 family phosphatase, partial [Burkholderiaceae bacterium]|nr:TIGR01244 family phosphatase [Burkholderiaceae bacterium]
MSIHISCHNPNFGTAGQIEPSDVDQIAKQGYRSIINNRPDGEEGPEQP